MGMVIVDGGHSYEVAKSDTQNALRLVRNGGIIVWDDYGDFLARREARRGRTGSRRTG